jgi:3'-5' exoribonuclease
MSKKEIFLSDIRSGSYINIPLMVKKIIFKEGNKITCILFDRTGEIKANIQADNNDIAEGKVIELEGFKDGNLDIKSYKPVYEYDLLDYLPSVNRSVDEIMAEIEMLTNKYVVSQEGRTLSNYFFQDKMFLDKFRRGIGGVSMHHNYIGGLAEHTLSVMQLTVMLCEKYNCRRTEIAVLAAKLHDIGKIYEFNFDGPFKYSLRGEMEGHIVIGVEMVEKAFRQNPELYTDDFITRIKGCIVQHHGKNEYGSPREMNMEESFIINYADSIDATMNKISQVKTKTDPGSWSEFDRRIETKLYL